MGREGWRGKGKTHRTGGSRGSANTFRKQKCITVHVSKKMSCELTARAEGRQERVTEMLTEKEREKGKEIWEKIPLCDVQ